MIKINGFMNSLFINKIRNGITGAKVDDKYITIYLYSLFINIKNLLRNK